MAASRKRGESGEASASPLEGATATQKAPVVQVPSNKPAIGDIVMYSHRRMNKGSDGKDYQDMPMIVTQVWSPTLIAGVVFTESTVFATSGAKVVMQAERGEGGGKWRPRA